MKAQNEAAKNIADGVLHDLCKRAWNDYGPEAKFNAIQEWLNDNKDNHDICAPCDAFT